MRMPSHCPTRPQRKLSMPHCSGRGILLAGDLASLAGDESLFAATATEKLMRLQAELQPLAERYDVVVANPPYMGSSSLGKWNGKWIKDNFPEAYRDLCTSFIDRGFSLSNNQGYSAMVTMQSWMFLGSYEKLRGKLLRNHTISSMAHLGTRAFDAIGGEVVSTTATVFANKKYDVPGTYLRLVNMGSEQEKAAGALEALANPNCGWLYHLNAALYSKLPGSPIVYWISPSFQNLCFDYVPLERNVYFKEGITTGDNETYLRLWHEVSNAHFYSLSDKGSVCATRSWIPCNKGGAFRRWYGNNDYVIDWTNDGNDLAAFPRSSFRNASYQRKEGVSYSNLSTGLFAARYSPTGFAFESKGTTCFSEDPFSTLAYLNSSIFGELTKYVCPTLDFKFGILQKLPDLQIAECSQIAKKCVQYTKEDWDSFETSWEFHSHPLV